MLYDCLTFKGFVTLGTLYFALFSVYMRPCNTCIGGYESILGNKVLSQS